MTKGVATAMVAVLVLPFAVSTSGAATDNHLSVRVESFAQSQSSGWHINHKDARNKSQDYAGAWIGTVVLYGEALKVVAVQTGFFDKQPSNESRNR